MHRIPDSRGPRWPGAARFVGPVFVSVALIVACALAHHYVVHYGTATPALDDLMLLPSLQADFTPTLEWTWSHHNDHRIPLPRLLFWALVRGSHDFRAGTLVIVTAMGALALAFVLAARKVRGRTSPADAFFPLAWLSWGHSENLLNSFQVVFVLSTVIVCACLIAFALLRGRPSATTVAIVSAGAILLPLCSVVGLVQMPFLAAWLAWVGLSSRRRQGKERRIGVIALVSAVVAVAVGAATLVGFTRLQDAADPTLERALVVAAQFLASPVGWIALPDRQKIGVWCALAIAAAVVVLLRCARNDVEQRARWLGIAMVLLAIVTLALSIGFGRGSDEPNAGTRSRYAAVALPWACALYLFACSFDARRLAKVAQGSLLALSAWLYVGNIPLAASSGEQRVRAASALERDVARGHSYSRLGAAHWHEIYYGPDNTAEALRLLDRGGYSPFRRARGPDPDLLVGIDPHESVFRVPASVLAGPAPIVDDVDGWRVLVVRASSELELRVPPEATCARGFFGIPSAAWQHADSAAVRFVVEVVDEGGARLASFERALQPVDVETDRRKADFGLAFERGAGRRLILRTERFPPETEKSGFGWWNDVRVR